MYSSSKNKGSSRPAAAPAAPTAAVSTSAPDDDELPDYSSAPPAYSATATDNDMLIDDILPIGLPPDKTMLSSCTLEQLINFCTAANINQSAFTDTKQYVAALQKLYPESNKSTASQKLELLPGASLLTEEITNVNTLFIQLLNKLQVEPAVSKNLQQKYTITEKIDVLGDSTR